MNYRFVVILSFLFPCLSPGSAVWTVLDEVTAETPRNIAYNLGHFYPGSNTSDWWRYSRVSGARIFLSPHHFQVRGAARPGESRIDSEERFLARRAALRGDPLNPRFINWPLIEERFNTPLPGRNRIVPGYALGEIHRHGGAILAQLSVTQGAFPIDGDDDWHGKWVLWRTYYSLAFHLAREFDVERFSSHNEPNHPHSLIAPESWLLRLRLASDAAQCALEDVNRLYGKSLQPKFAAPVTAGGGRGTGYREYGLPAVEQIGIDFRGETAPGYQTFHLYAYQAYNHSPAGFARHLREVREGIRAASPEGIVPLRFAITEFNVHTGANYDGMPESSHSLSKAVRFGAITGRLADAGMDELYAFKFGLTAWGSGDRRFPVQKNGMLFTDNDREPHNHGTMTRSAEVFRLFSKGFAPGRERLASTLTGDGAENLAVLAGRDPVRGYHYLFSVNENGSGVPVDIDLSALGIEDGRHVMIEDVSRWRTGIVRSLERVRNGRIAPGSQPGPSVWLITIPPACDLHTLPVTRDLMVRDGTHAETGFAEVREAYARNSATDTGDRAAVFLQFDLPDGLAPEDIALAVVALPVAPMSGGPETVHAHLYGIDHHDWDPDTLTWSNAPNLRQNVPPGNAIRHGGVRGAGDTAHILGQLTISGGFHTRQVDVTDYLVRQDGDKASFLIVQDPRWDLDIRVDTVPETRDAFAEGDKQPDGMRLRTRREAGSPAEAARLLLFRRPPPGS